MKIRNYAKSINKDDTNYETIDKHTDELLRHYTNFFEIYDNLFSEKEKKLIEIACRYHDLGKYNYYFQNQMQNIKNKTNKSNLNHGFISSLLLDNETLKDFDILEQKILITAIHYHHTRSEPDNFKIYQDFIDEYFPIELQKELNLHVNYNNSDNLLFKYKKDMRAGSYVDDETYVKFSIIKGMLNKFDYLASSHQNETEIVNINYDIINQIKNKFNNLKKVQEFALANKDNNIVFIAPTGSGKTEASLLWSDNKKTFYFLPLQVASNNIFERIKNNYNYENIALLHSNALDYYINNEENFLDNYYKAKNLSYPLTISTIDQLFSFSLKTLGSEILLATLKYSRIIIDEIQMYEPKTLGAILYGLKLLNMINVKFCIMTATFPPFLRKLLKSKKYCNINNFVYKEFVSDDLKRHFISLNENDFDYDLITKKALSSKVLVICNTVRKSQEVYDILKNNNKNIKLLHSRFVRQERNEIEKEIINFSNSKQNGIYITTQIVEASLDVDFDYLFTEFCPADSLIQRMGRCYRKRNYDLKEPNVYIYKNKNTIYDKDLFKLSWNNIQNYNNTLFLESQKLEYVNKTFGEEIEDTSYYQKILRAFNDCKKQKIGDYKKDELNIRDINNITAIPYDIYYNTNKEEIDNLINIIHNKDLNIKERYNARKKLYDFTIHVPNQKKYRFQNPIIDDIYIVLNKYNKELGLLEEDEMIGMI